MTNQRLEAPPRVPNATVKTGEFHPLLRWTAHRQLLNSIRRGALIRIFSLLLMANAPFVAASPYVYDHLRADTNPYHGVHKMTGVDPFVQSRFRNLTADLASRGFQVRVNQVQRTIGWKESTQARWDSGNRTGLAARPSDSSVHFLKLAFDISVEPDNAEYNRILLANGFYRPIETLLIEDLVHVELNPEDAINQIGYYNEATRALEQQWAGFDYSAKRRMSTGSVLTARYPLLDLGAAYENLINDIASYQPVPFMGIQADWDQIESLLPQQGPTLFPKSPADPDPWLDRYHIPVGDDSGNVGAPTSRPAWEDEFMNEFSRDHQFEVNLD